MASWDPFDRSQSQSQSRPRRYESSSSQRTRHDSSSLQADHYSYDVRHPYTPEKNRILGAPNRQRRAWPPAPSVEEEKDALAREFGSRFAPVDDHVQSRGSVDQEPLIMEVPEFIPDRRFVWKPSEPANTAANPTPPTSDDERNSRRDRRKMPKLETETLPEMRRAPSPYNFSKQTSQAHHRSSGEYLLSPDVLTPPPASSFANPPRSTPTSIPEPNILRPHVGARSASQTANSVASKPGGDSQDDESFVQRRTPARYSYTKPDADVARSSTATLHNVSSADRYNPTMSSPTLFTESPSVLSPADLPERIRSAAPPKVASRLDTTLSTRSRHYSESRSAQVSRDPSPRSSQSYYPPSPPRSPGVIASRNRDAAPRSIPDRRPSSRGASIHSSSPHPSPLLSDSLPAADYLLASLPASSAAYRPQQPSRLSSFTRANLSPPVPAYTSSAKTETLLPYPTEDGTCRMPSEVDHQYFPDQQSALLPPFSEDKFSSRTSTPSGSTPNIRQAPVPLPRRSTLETLATPMASPRSPLPTTTARVEKSKTRSYAQLITRPLPPCPRADYSTKFDDWYTIEGCPNFDVCPSCLEEVFEDTPFRSSFKRASRRGPGRDKVETRCDFSDPWIRLAWLLTLQRELPTLSLIRSIANLCFADEDGPCPGAAEAMANWHSVRDRDGHFLRGFTVCPQDVEKIEVLLPGFRGLLVPLPMRPSSTFDDDFGSLTQVCSLRAASNNRFPVYLDRLISLHEPALGRNRLPDASDFISLVRHKTLLYECRRDDMLYNQRWHFIPSLSPAFTVCEDCYDEIVEPHVQADSDVAMRFNRRAQLVHGEGGGGLSCQLYSPYMRRVFKQAVEGNDMKYLTRKAEERKDMEDRLQERVTSIRRQTRRLKHSSAYGRNEKRVNDELYDLQKELDGIVEEWRRWE